jgi:hypothetical protein
MRNHTLGLRILLSLDLRNFCENSKWCFIGYGVKQLGFSSWICHVLAVWPNTNYLAPTFLVSSLKITGVLTNGVVIKWDSNVYMRLSMVPATQWITNKWINELLINSIMSQVTKVKDGKARYYRWSSLGSHGLWDLSSYSSVLIYRALQCQILWRTFLVIVKCNVGVCSFFTTAERTWLNWACPRVLVCSGTYRP